MIWNIHALLPPCKSERYDLASFLFAPQSRCPHWNVSPYWALYKAASRCLQLSCTWLLHMPVGKGLALLCQAKSQAACFPFCLRSTADILSGWAFGSHNFSHILWGNNGERCEKGSNHIPWTTLTWSDMLSSVELSDLGVVPLLVPSRRNPLVIQKASSQPTWFHTVVFSGVLRLFSSLVHLTGLPLEMSPKFL